MVHILIYVLLYNVHTFYLCITKNDAKKVATLRIPERKVGNRFPDTRTLCVSVYGVCVLKKSTSLQIYRIFDLQNLKFFR